MNTKLNTPYLEIVEQPIDHIRFRYESDSRSHGNLTGKQTDTFPTVCLRNFNGPAKIRCSLYQIPKLGIEPLPHSHSLVVEDGKSFIKDPHDVLVSRKQGYQATFKGMRIISRKKKEIQNELFEKFVAKYEFEYGEKLTPEQRGPLEEKAASWATKVNLNQVALHFEAYIQINDKWKRLCDPVFSTPINEISKRIYNVLIREKLGLV